MKRQEKMFFFEKKPKNFFLSLATPHYAVGVRGQFAEVFCCFFAKEKPFSVPRGAYLPV
jgi:hypothetical protein